MSLFRRLQPQPIALGEGVRSAFGAFLGIAITGLVTVESVGFPGANIIVFSDH